MIDRRVRVIDVIIEERAAGIAVATSPSLPTFCLITEQNRLEEDIPGAIKQYYQFHMDMDVEVLPVEEDEQPSVAQWAAIIAKARSGAVA